MITEEVQVRLAFFAHRMSAMLGALRQVAIHRGHPLLASRTAQLITALRDLGYALGDAPPVRDPTMPRGDYRNQHAQGKLFASGWPHEGGDDPATDDELAWETDTPSELPAPFGNPGDGEQIPPHQAPGTGGEA